MQQPVSQEVVSSSFLIDIFDRFISKTFENDSNYSFLSKEWNNFRAILTKGSLDLEQVFRYLAQLQLNIDQYTKTPVNQSLEEKSVDKNTNSQLPVNNQGNSAEVNSEVLNTTAQLPPGYSKQSSFANLDTVVSPSIRTETTYSSPTVLAKNYSGPIVRQNTITSNAVTGSSRLQLSFLADKAKSMRSNIQGHSSKLVAAVEKTSRSVQTPLAKQDDRSELRKIVLYAKAPNFNEVAKNIDAKISNMKDKNQNETVVFC